MNAIEAMQALKDGKKIYKKQWSDEEFYYVELNENNQIIDQQGEFSYICTENLTADDWELYDDTEYFDFFEAIARIKEGKKVSHASSDKFIYKFDEDSHMIILEEFGNEFSFIEEEINSNKWYEVKEWPEIGDRYKPKYMDDIETED